MNAKLSHQMFWSCRENGIIQDDSNNPTTNQNSTASNATTFQRKRSIHIPDKGRRIVLKKLNETVNHEGEVRKVGIKEGEVFLEIITEDDDIIVIFINEIFEWRYSKFTCPRCSQKYDIRRGLGKHISRHFWPILC